MWEYVKMVGGLLIVSLLAAHFFLLALFVAPSDKLLATIVQPGGGFIEAEELPENVETFLLDNHVPVEGDYMPDSSLKTKLVLGILRVREAYFMKPREALAMNMNLLDYGQGAVGLKGAAYRFFGTPLSQLSDKHWVNLVNLHEIVNK